MSLFLRLAIGFLLLIILCGASATFSAWQQTRDTVNELFDTQQMLFAKRLLALDASRLQAASLPKTKRFCATIAAIRMTTRWPLRCSAPTANRC